MINFIFVALALLSILFAGLPVAFSLGATSTLLVGLYDLPMKIIANSVFSSLDSFIVVSVPLFVLMSHVLLSGKIGDDLFDVMNAWVRHLPGGLAIATILACAFFSAISGSSAATAATIGMVAYPAMVERGYDKKLILGLLAAGGTLGILIPPSIPLIIYGAVTEESVGKLFVAGIVPGLMMTGFLIGYAVFRCKQGGFAPQEPASWKERFELTLRNIWGIALPFLIIGGIYTGVCTPTEAAAIGLVYSLVITLVIYRTLQLRDIPGICLKAVTTSCMIAMIIGGAVLFGRVMTLLEIPQKLTEFIITWKLSAFMFVLVMNILMLVLGCILETVSIILLTMPLVAPILAMLNIDPIWYAIVLTVNMEIALVTPPVGMNLYVISGLREDINMGQVIRGVFPFIILLFMFLLLTMLVPSLSTWLPSLMQ
ncbi:MAG: C4-dicarboxylate ABC transporter permease [Desulfobacterales bacterium RIFOXYA12_FULL_46_15]|nr:MAG: C4-dicarboxylate ABC transporter permease [Desulfobacterales bacterium RIFOXYA12_FULL_46_15]